MSENTKIEWCDHTFNPWIGCTKVGPGCDNCYAKADFDDRKHRVTWGAGQARSRTKTWGDPVRWNREHETFFAANGRRQRVFCASLADVFDNAVDPQWRDDLWQLIWDTPNLDWLLLTKRVGNVPGMLPEEWGNGMIPYWPNVWLGATIVNQEEADRDIPKLLAVPAVKRFLSMEPLLGPVNLDHLNDGKEVNEVSCLKPYTWEEEIEQWRGTEDDWEESFEDHYGTAPTDGLSGPMHNSIDWVIVGGESGPGARPMHPDWSRSLRDQCQGAGVPFLFKQWGEWLPGGHYTTELAKKDSDPSQSKFLCAQLTEDEWGYGYPHSSELSHRTEPMYRVSKKAAGRLLDGITHDGYPS